MLRLSDWFNSIVCPGPDPVSILIVASLQPFGAARWLTFAETQPWNICFYSLSSPSQEFHTFTTTFYWITPCPNPFPKYFSIMANPYCTCMDSQITCCFYSWIRRQMVFLHPTWDSSPLPPYSGSVNPAFSFIGQNHQKPLRCLRCHECCLNRVDYAFPHLFTSFLSGCPSGIRRGNMRTDSKTYIR